MPHTTQPNKSYPDIYTTIFTHLVLKGWVSNWFGYDGT